MNENCPSDRLLSTFSVKQIIGTFNLLSDVLFWVKDPQSRIVFANASYVEHQGFKSLAQLVGKTDLDFSPIHIARQFINDDIKVMQGQLVTNRLELNLVDKEKTAWFLTSKRPIYDDHGEIQGTYGITRHLQKTSQELTPFQDIEVPVKFVKQHFAESISVDDMAQAAHLSVSALERRFKKHLGKTPRQFITEVRLEHARKRIVETNTAIAQIAYDCGFNDASYFSQQFKLLFGELPSALRKEHSIQ